MAFDQMPEGYIEFVRTFENLAIVGYPDQAAELMKEMAEALEIAYCNGCESEKDWEIISAARNKFKEWK